MRWPAAGKSSNADPRSSNAPTATSSSSPTSHRTTFKNLCGWCRATRHCSPKTSVTASTTPPAATSTSRATALRVQQLVSDLLHYARVSRGADTGRQRVDCDQLVEWATVDLHEAIAAAGATVTHAPLPTVTGMRTEIEQLFTNLVGNAVKFRGEEPVRVHVSAARDGPMWRFSVADNGIGIDPAQAERIFDVFRRLHKPGSYPGTGIGLAICKKVVEHHGGRIWVESQPGTGATFRFTLPAADNDQVDR